MNNDPLENRATLLLSKVAADAAAEVQAAVVRHAASMGRSGIVMALRAQACELGASAIGYDQISSLAFESAADDMAWGRTPLATWRPFALGAAGASILERRALRARLPRVDPEAMSRGEQIARAIEHRLLSKHDAFEAIREHSAALEGHAEIQSALWDDPRIAATSDVRLIMRATIDPLRHRIHALAPAPAPQAAPLCLERAPEAQIRGWRRLFMARRILPTPRLRS
ncbi:MAG: hypothetical protein Q8M88_02780 [Phenylobacterium sp.]|uniref:hypothetical protein n=1 Tax=Phenylobacterium sp. TaxID=1871053 RepID=UPI00273584DA|nr:hypothetical protein [Phenylobacterium sp.]MDP3173344.1 hypothetical protein [Phenylobacterium sp.]